MSVSDVLEEMDGRLKSVATGVAQGQYVFWLGSGLSRSVVPDVAQLLRKLLGFLQQESDAGDVNCPFVKALGRVLDISGLPDVQRSAIDLALPADSWPHLDDLIQRLIGQYSTVLDVLVDGREPDYLVWEGVNVVDTYGAASLEPATEHICVATLMLEGVVTSAPSANWDGLVERAVLLLAGEGHGLLRVIVRPEEFSAPATRSDLIKFHGCAVKAGDDPGTYRSALIARESQISTWTTKAENAVMKSQLELLVSTKSSFVVGLSVQDANLHTILGQASENLGRCWPVDPPAFVFALEQLDHRQTHVLSIAYGDSYPPNSQQIEEAARLGAYAQPVLIALVLFTLENKLEELASASIPAAWDSAATQKSFATGLRSLRALAASGLDAAADVRAELLGIIAWAAAVMSIFRVGRVPEPSGPLYEPLTAQPVSTALVDPNVDTDALGMLAIVGALLGQGASDGLWAIRPRNDDVAETGVACVVSSGSIDARLVIVRDSAALAQLEGDGHVRMTDPDVVIVHAKEIPQRQSRSPRGRFGRTLRRCAREISVEAIVVSADDPESLLLGFRQQAAL